MNNAKVTVAIIKSITAIACCVAVALTGNTIANKVCDTNKSIAESGYSSSATADPSGSDAADSETAGDTQQEAPGEVVDTPEADDSSAEAETPADDSSSEAEAPAGDSSSSSKPAEASKEISLAAGLNSSKVEDVLKFYQLAAKKNEKRKYTTVMALKSLDGGEGAVGGLISAFKPIAVKALEKNSEVTDKITGVPAQIKPSDWKSATATSDGTYTTLKINIVDQKAGVTTKSNEGTVGRSINIVDGVQSALDELDGVTADFAGSDFYILYNNASMTLKVKNSTGEFVSGSCKWHFDANVMIGKLDVKVTFIKATLKNAKGVVTYDITC